MVKTKSLKIISVLLAIIMAFTFFTLPVRAEALMAAAAAVVLGNALRHDDSFPQDLFHKPLNLG